MVPDPEDTKRRFLELYDWKGPVFAISGLTGEGTQDLLYALLDYLDAEREKEYVSRDQAEGTYVAPDPRFDDTRSDADKPAAPRAGDE
ncbi:hypothetical protein G6F40_017958 [Rhizopus arrhizus]|nr:hypothetical protein G6F40_017958 [Rhizopus arrhizus]